MYRILVADDEPIERMVVEKVIRKNFSEQLEVFTGVNGREAITVFEEKQCDIALLDIEMPGVNGLEAATEIRKNNKQAVIIFLTAFDEFGYAKKAIEVKALDYLVKPTTEEELVSVLEEAIRLIREQETYASLQSADANSSANKNLLNDEKEEELREGHSVRMSAVAKAITNYIELHYMEDIALQDVAEAMNYSDAYFCKLFKQCFNKSFVSYLTWYRIERAKEALSNIRINIKDVSINVGYRDSNYFAKVFKRMVGITPSEYRYMVLKDKDTQ